MVVVAIELIAIGISLMTPIYYGLYLLSQQDNVSALARAKLTGDLENNSKQLTMTSNDLHKTIENVSQLTLEITRLATCLNILATKVDNCHFCNTEARTVEFDDDEWQFRSR